MARVRDGELERLGDLFDRHHRRLYGFFARLSGGASGRGAAEDLVQEVFVRMLRYRHTFRSDAEFAPWMYALARNAATDLWRHRPRELPVEPEAPEPAAPERDPLAGLLAHEQSARLAAGLARLAPEKRELILLARSGELRYDRIAEMLGLTVGAVKVRVHRAMKELRAACATLAAEAGSAR
jgi:RNA polymerase sigma-70 factor (ECF subfamily)